MQGESLLQLDVSSDHCTSVGSSHTFSNFTALCEGRMYLLILIVMPVFSLKMCDSGIRPLEVNSLVSVIHPTCYRSRNNGHLHPL